MMDQASNNADLTDLKVMLARVDERVAALQRDAEASERVADARHAESRAAQALSMPRAEIEGMNKVLGERMDSLHKAMSDRVAALEGFRGLVFRYSLMAGALVIGGLVALGKLAPAILNLP